MCYVKVFNTILRMRKSISTILSLSLLLSCNTQLAKEINKQNGTEMGKKNIGSLLALYPKPMMVVGAEVEGKVNWLVVGHTGIIGHDRILVSMSKSHHTNQGIKDSKKTFYQPCRSRNAAESRLCGPRERRIDR